MNRLDKSILYSCLIILCFLSACKADEVPDKFLEIEMSDDYVVKIPNYGEYKFVQKNDTWFHGQIYFDSIADMTLKVSSSRDDPSVKESEISSDYEWYFFFQSGACDQLKKGRSSYFYYHFPNKDNFTAMYLEYGGGSYIHTKQFKCLFHNEEIRVSIDISTSIDTFDLLADWEWANQFKDTHVIKVGE